MPARLTRTEPLRLFMTADAVGGVWTYALDLARGLACDGVETRLAVLGPDPDAAQAAEAARIPGLQLLATGLLPEWLAESSATALAAGEEIARLARASGADLVHLNSPALAARARFHAPVVALCHSCLATWWDAVREGPLPADFAWRTELVGAGYRRANALVAPTAAFAQTTARRYGLAEAPRVVRNGRQPSLPPENSAAATQPRAEPVVAFTAGRLWDEGKNIAALDRAAARLDMPVLAAGPVAGPNGAAISLRHIRALGPLSEAKLAQHLAARPVFVSLARYEPFGLAVLEAAQAGCALVLSDIATFRELWDGAALFVPADDDAFAAEAIANAAQDPALRQSLGAAARERAGTYTVEAMTSGLLAVYRELLGREAPLGREVAA